jgi:hypothetical protein
LGVLGAGDVFGFNGHLGGNPKSTVLAVAMHYDLKEREAEGSFKQLNVNYTLYTLSINLHFGI